jgi:eukaryotic-like serine/threonine-protein kinase
VKAGKATEARALIRDQLAIARKRFPADSPQLAGVLVLSGWNLLELKDFPAADPLLRECLSIREKADPDSWLTFNTRSLLGGALLGQKKYADAEPLLVQGYEGMKDREKTIPPNGKVRLPEAAARLVELYLALDKPDEVKKWKAVRAEYEQPSPPEPKPDGTP